MEQHSKELLKLCRLCRKKVNINASYYEAKTCEEFKDKILMLFCHDISKDSILQHPSKLCHNCTVKLGKVKYDNQFLKPSLAEFQQHDDNCSLCRLHRLSEHKYQMKQSKKFDLNSLVSVCKDNGFFVVDAQISLVKIGLLNQSNVITLFITVNQDLTWKLKVFQRDISGDSFVKTLPAILSAENILDVLQELKTAKICAGNNDFHDLVEHKVEGFDSFKPQGHLEDQQLNVLNTCEVTIRSQECSVLLSSNYGPDRCEFCTRHRKTLLNMNRKLPSIVSSATKKKRPYSSMSKKQLKRKLFDSSVEIKELQRQKRLLEKKLNQSTKEKGKILNYQNRDRFIALLYVFLTSSFKSLLIFFDTVTSSNVVNRFSNLS